MSTTNPEHSANTIVASTVVVTGAFSYTGNHFTCLLLSRGADVRTLTGHPQRQSPFGDPVSAAPLVWEAPERLKESLRGASTLVNTYWVRFNHGKVTFDRAVENTRILIRGARDFLSLFPFSSRALSSRLLMAGNQDER